MQRRDTNRTGSNKHSEPAKQSTRRANVRKTVSRDDQRSLDLRKLNSRINFDLEGSKGNARKDETTVICCNCRAKFTLPFKPRRPEVYCDSCFKKKNKR